MKAAAELAVEFTVHFFIEVHRFPPTKDTLERPRPVEILMELHCKLTGFYTN